MDKRKIESLMVKAEDALQESKLLSGPNKTEIKNSYNGQIAALGVSVAMIGILPTLAIYYQDDKNGRQNVLNVIAHITKGQSFNGRSLLELAIKLKKDNRTIELKELAHQVMDASVALKQIVRTYKLVKENENHYEI